ncbi:pyridoxal phosphate-dependent aminotransferase [Halolamina sp. C58]|uniref:pyridoxal phosphate-dependent aminotransferase n=1 Tax=Halolamina sp. C58 TaxID=3421640 RepID=UPI003EBD7686
MFEPMPYLEWIEGRPGAADHDLGSSDLRTEQADGSVAPPPLSGLPDPNDPPSLSASIAAEYGVDESAVLVTAGATHANFLAAAAALSLAEGEEVVVEEPGYDPLVHTPAGIGGTVSRFDRPARSGYPLLPSEITAALSERTALVTVTNRHNPSGRLTPREELASVAEAVGDAGSRLLVDEVYGPYTAEDDAEGAFGGVTAAGIPNTVVTGSFTKFHGLGGLQVGWLIADEPFVERAREAFMHVPAVAEPSRALARRFFAHRDELVADSRSQLRRNYELLSSFVEERSDLDGEIAAGCTFGFVEHERADGDELAAAAWNAGVLVIPGRFFDVPSGVRLSAGRSPEAVESGLETLGEVLDEL